MAGLAGAVAAAGVPPPRPAAKATMAIRLPPVIAPVTLTQRRRSSGFLPGGVTVGVLVVVVSDIGVFFQSGVRPSALAAGEHEDQAADAEDHVDGDPQADDQSSADAAADLLGR